MHRKWPMLKKDHWSPSEQAENQFDPRLLFGFTSKSHKNIQKLMKHPTTLHDGCKNKEVAWHLWESCSGHRRHVVDMAFQCLELACGVATSHAKYCICSRFSSKHML